MSFSVGIRLSVSSSQYLMSISCALQEAYAAMSGATAGRASYYGLAAMSAAAAEGNSFTAGLSGLAAGTTYYYQAYVKVQGTGDKSSSVQTFTGDVNQFTTEAEEVGGLLELPARRDPSEALWERWPWRGADGAGFGHYAKPVVFDGATILCIFV